MTIPEGAALKSGARKTYKDHRDFSFHRTFGAVTNFPAEYNVDSGFGFPDQNADGLPYGCTGYTQSELGQDEDGIKYLPAYTYKQTRLMEGTYDEPVGCDIRDSLKSATIYGLQAEGETEAQALLHRKGRYFNVIDPFNNMDAFDDCRNGMFLFNSEKRSVSIGVPWFPEWEGTASDGVLPQPHDFNVSRASWHNAKVSGWKLINGAPYLIVKSWQGPNYGDHGYCYIGRDLFNQVMTISGTGAFTLSKMWKNDIQYVRLTIIETLLSYMRRLAKLL